MVRKGAIVSIDFLELSIILNAPFAAGFLEVILKGQNRKDTPFLEVLVLTANTLIEKHPNSLFPLSD